jgi:cell division cycle 20-like protein 1 (cofactor of APC complex)
MDSLSIRLDYNVYNHGPSRHKTNKSYKISHKNTISYNRFKTYKSNTNLDNEPLRTGDRFIPFKDEDNFQNFILKTPNLTLNYDLEKAKKNEEDLLSPLEEKHETNYANFIVDNMLRTSTDQYNFPYSKFARFRSNSIYTFSKRVSYNSINTNINNSINNSNNQEKDNKILFEYLKINNSNIKKTHIKNSNELLRTKNKINKNKNNLNISPILYEPQNQINSIFNENNNRSNSDLIFQFIDASSNKRNVLPDTDYLLANYSCNNIYKRKINLIPERILDAPNLVDDYYLNLLEWGRANILAVALGPEIFMEW